MKKEVVKELEHALDEIDVLKNNIDEIDLPFGEMHITDIRERINKVMTTLKQEIEFDDALKGVGAVPVITGDKDTDALLEDEQLNQEKLNIPNNCHIHSWEHDEYDALCQLCTNEYVVGE